MRSAAILLVGVGLAGCATTDPGSGVQIGYKMPRTDGRVSMAVDITQCESSPGIDELEAAATLKVEVVAGADDKRYRVEGRRLASAVVKRGLTIGRDPDTGVITGINASASDQRSVILANVVAFAAKAVAFAANPRGPRGYRLVCTDTTKAVATEIRSLRAAIATRRDAMATASDTKPLTDAMLTAATRIAALREQLHRDIVGKITIPSNLYALDTTEPEAFEGAGRVIKDEDVRFDWTPFKDFVTSVPFGGAPGLADATDPAHGADADFRVVASFRRPADTAIDGLAWTKEPANSVTACSLWVKVPAPLPINLVVDPVGPIYGDEPVDKRATVQPVVAAQLQEPGTVCLSAGFGENRTVGLKFDKFGATTEMAWASDARAATISSALGGIGGDALGIASTMRGRALADDKAELDRLNTSQALRKARACQELLDAGATKCE